MERTWLVDGLNVIGSRPDGWWRDRTGAMARLATRLDAFARATGDAVHVVFDGRPRELGLPPDTPVEVEFAAGGRGAADRAIVERVAAEPNPDELRVVTSDGSLAARARAAGTPVTGAGAFRRLLEEAGPPPAA